MAILYNESVTKQPNSYSLGIAITLQDLLQCTKYTLSLRERERERAALLFDTRFGSLGS